MFERIQELYEEYVAEFQELEQERRVGAGMFGLTNGPRNYPCHGQFSKDLERLLKEEAANAAAEEAEQVLEYVYLAPQGRKKQDSVYWMMTAVHSLTEELILRLTPEAAGRLLGQYQDAYPRRTLLPAQKKILSALKDQAAAG